MKTRIFKAFAVLMILALTASSAVYAATAAAAVPSDVAGTAYENAVKALVEKEIITGDTDGLFHPDSNLTRAQASIIVVKSMNPPATEITGTATQPAAKSGYLDMSGYGWAEGYISYAVKHGVTKGYPDGTFKPGNKVTMKELITMVLRAADYTDESLGGTWPSNYIAKASELGLLANVPSPLPTLATKWMAAQLDYDALSKIEAANPPAETPGQGTDQDKPGTVPNTAAMTYANASFNSTMTSYGGKAFADNVKVYTYGKEKDYSSTMKFSAKISDYREDSVYKYKSVETPAFYKLENGKITEMAIPSDVGFSGRAYSVINGTVKTLNAKGDTVTGLSTLTATHEITWLAKAGLADIPDKADYGTGEVYELNLYRGEIQSVFTSSDAGKKGAVFEKISGPGNFVTVESFKNGVVTLYDGTMFEVKDNATIYILGQDDPGQYTAGKLSGIKSGALVNAYDISDDDELSADLVVINKSGIR